MSSPLMLIVLGQAYFLGTTPNIPLAGLNSLSPIPDNKSELIESQPTPKLPARRADYTYTPGIGGHKVHRTAKPWNEARLICEEEGGYLAIINSPAESEVISQLFYESLPHFNSDDSAVALVGFHDLFEEGQYVTIHGDSLEKAGFNEWSWGEPNDGETGEDCGSVLGNGTLNDIRCTKSVAFFCELPYTD